LKAQCPDGAVYAASTTKDAAGPAHGATGSAADGGADVAADAAAEYDAYGEEDEYAAGPGASAAPEPGNTDVEAAYIRWGELGPPCSMLSDDLPDWRFELDASKWKSYTLEDSIVLDRFMEAFRKKQAIEEDPPRLAKVRLLRKECIVDLQALTCQVGDSRPRKLQRHAVKSGWLSNRYFFEAFKAALAGSGVTVDAHPEEMFDFRFNQDFRNLADDGRKLMRGGQPYQLPLGWKRFAVNVKGQYDDGDNKWLKEDDSGWAVAYHGTTGEGLTGILCTGFRVGDRQKFENDTGAGIYCTPLIDVAQHYSKPKKYQGHTVQIVLQLRVKPSAIKHITDSSATPFEKKYWVINNPAHIRAYGVLIRELSLLDYVPPEVMVYGKSNPHVQKILKELIDEHEANK